MTVNTWIVVAGDPAIGTLISTARSLGGEVTAAVVGTRQVAETVAAGGVDKVIWFGEPGDAPVEAFATAVADTVAAAPGVVLGGMGPSERVLLMPEANDREQLRARSFTVAEAARARGFRFSSRLHLELWGGRRGT